MKKTVLLCAACAALSSKAVAIENTYEMVIQSNDMKVMTIPKRNQPICERDLQAVAATYQNFMSGQCVPIGTAEKSLKEGVHEQVKSVMDKACNAGRVCWGI